MTIVVVGQTCIKVVLIFQKSDWLAESVRN